MKEKVKQVNQTSNESPKRFLSECPEHQRNGNLQDIQVLQCVNSTSEITRHERSDEQEQNSNETLGSGLNHSMKSWFDIPLSKIVTEPLNSQIRNQVGLSSFSHFFPEIGSGFLENTVPHNFSMLKNHCSPADFTQKLPENLRQHVSNSLHCQQNSDVHSLAQQQFVALGDAMNISATKSNSANGKEPIISRISDEYREVRTSPGELIQGTFSLERSRKRKRREEDEIIKSPLQRKMEHLHKEKERRLRQTKCFEHLRNLVPSCDIKTDKANVLEVTVEYLNYIKETLGSKMVIVEKGFLEDLKRKQDSSN